MWIKVCGIVDAANAAAVAASGVSAIGLNFYPKSKRFISNHAAAVRSAIDNRCQAIGLFVDANRDEILRAAEAYSLDAIQLHGDEPPALIDQLAPLPVYRAIRVVNGSIGQTIDDQLAEIRSFANLAGILIDAASVNALGGTGQTIDWAELAASKESGWPPLVLAGGLTPENVAAAVQTVLPWGVDVASGVEASPGIKDVHKVERFVQAANTASNSQPE